MQSDSRRRRIRLIKSVESRNQPPRRPKAPRRTKSGETQENSASLLRRLFIECGGNPAVQLLVEREGEPARSFTMDRPFRLVGNDVSCDIRLDDEAVSPRHSVIHWIDGRLFCCSISQQPTVSPGQNREPINRWLDERPLVIGPYQISVLPPPPTTTSSPSPLDRSLRIANEYPRLGFQFVGVEQLDALWPINRIMTLIGRGAQCKLRLNHKSVATVQAMLVRTSTGCWLTDLANDGTTAINDEEFKIAPIDVGDLLKFGDFQVEVVTTDFEPVPPAPAAVEQQKPTVREPIPEIATKPATEKQITAPLPAIKEETPAAVSQAATETERVTREVEPATVLEDERIEPHVPEIIETVGLNTNCSHAPVGVRIQPSIASDPIHTELFAVISSPCKPINDEQSQVIDSTFEPVVLTKEQAAPIEIEVPAAEIEETIPIPIDQLASPCDLLATEPARDCDKVIAEEAPTIESSPIVSSVAEPSLNPVRPVFVDLNVQVFVDTQKAKLLELKKQLLALERVYNEESKYMVSQRMRRNLAAPITETMKSYESIMASLEQFMNPPLAEEVAADELQDSSLQQSADADRDESDPTSL